MGRPARKRGGKASKRGLSQEQVCLVVAQDRQEHRVAEKVGTGPPTLLSVRRGLGPVLKRDVALCTDGLQPYRRLCTELGVQHCRVDGKRRLQGSIYHINHVNNWHKRFKDWIVVGLRGVASKYLDNYAAWSIFLA